MQVEVRLPKFGDQSDGTILEWHVAVGTAVSRGDILANIETAKAEVEIEAPCDGTVVAIAAAEDTTLNIGELMAVIETGTS